MPQTLTPFNAKKTEFDYSKLVKAKVNIRFNDSLLEARNILEKELRREAQLLSEYGPNAFFDEASIHLEEAFRALDQILRIQTTEDKINLGKYDERLGTRNSFEYYAKKAYLSTKRALPTIEKM